MNAVRWYVLTGFVVLLGAVYGRNFIKFCDEHPSARRGNLLVSLCAWDGEWYEKIATDGYSYSPDRQSSVAFFPAYPTLAKALAATGLDVRVALLLVSNICFLAALALLGGYLSASRSRDSAVLAAALLPATFYFRMAYSESLFLLLCVAAMLGMARRWPSISIALIVGAACATRPLGVALIAPYLLYLWPGNPEPANVLKFFALAIATLPIACWGLLAYAFYQWLRFDDPIAFLKAQQHWGGPVGDPMVRVTRLVTLAPVRAIYDPASPCYWGFRPPRDSALLSMMFANPIYFFGYVGCIVIGAWKRWLNAKEIALSAALLLIPFVTQADRMCMASMARFGTVAFPVYIVIGNLVERAPTPVVVCLAALSATMLSIYTAMFVNWYWYY